MSALRPEADIGGARRHVCYGPQSDIPHLLLRTPAANQHLDGHVQLAL